MSAYARLGMLSVAAALSVVACGCVLIGPAGVRADVVAATGVDLDREFGFRVGRFGMFLVRRGVKMADDEDFSLAGVNKVVVGVYRAHGAPGREEGRPLCRADLSDWEPVVRICEDGESVMMYTRERAGRLRGLLIVAQDGDEVVIVRARGRLDETVASVAELAGEEMRESRSREVPVCEPGGLDAVNGCADPDEARARVLSVADSLGA